jgi:hypothetical protein
MDENRFMSSSIRDPPTILLLLLLLAFGSTGCELALGDIPENPDLDAGAAADQFAPEVATGPDVSSPGDATLDRGASGDGCSANSCNPTDGTQGDVIGSSDIVAQDGTASDTTIVDTAMSDVFTADTPAIDAPNDMSVDRGSPDASVMDATSDPGVSDPCDMDHDTFRSDRCMGGNDCDDTTDQVYPGEPSFRDSPTHGDAGGGFDYNCSGKPELEFPDPLDCSGLALLNCDETKHAFLGKTTPVCGAAGPFGHCMKTTLACTPVTEEPNKIMRCK